MRTSVSACAAALPEPANNLLSVQGLTVGFEKEITGSIGLAVDDVSFSLQHGSTLCLVGESGCGKSITALSLLRLLSSPRATMLGGSCFFEGTEIFSLSLNDFLEIRGKKIGTVFQDPMTSLNPVMRVGRQITEGLVWHMGISAREAREEAIALLEKVGIGNARLRSNDFPHQMSGGMRQRVMIAMAIACRPVLLVADEPTTALDVTIQRQIIDLILELVHEAGSGLLLITHDLGIVAQCADAVAVMYAGSIVEQGVASDVLDYSLHPYTRGLLLSRRDMEAGGNVASARVNLCSGKKRMPLAVIPGTVPGLWARPEGCSFHPRCDRATDVCRYEKPLLRMLSEIGMPHQVRCHHPLL